MSVTNIKKINVRSPFYIEVKKDPVTVTPTDLTTAISCGDNVVVGQDVGIRKYTINQDARTGNHTLNISGVTVPVKFTATWDGNTVTTKYIGQEAYRQQMLDAGILAADLDLTNTTNPVSDTLTIDKTAATPALIEFKAESPIIHEGYTFDLACPDAIADSDPVTANSVVIFQAFSRAGQGFRANVTMNGTTLTTPSSAVVGSNTTNIVNVRHVFSDYTPNLEPDDSYKKDFFNNQNSSPYNEDDFDNTYVPTKAVPVTYHPETVLTTGINELIIEGTGTTVFYATMYFKVSKHPVYYNTTDAAYYIMSSKQNAADLGLTISPKAFSNQLTTSVGDAVFKTTIRFRGSNSTDLEIVEAFNETKHLTYGQDPNLGTYTDKTDISGSVFLVNQA